MDFSCPWKKLLGLIQNKKVKLVKKTSQTRKATNGTNNSMLQTLPNHLVNGEIGLLIFNCRTQYHF